MDTSFVERLENRARTMLPAATVMLLECAVDAGGGPDLEALLAEIQEKGLKGEPLCSELCETIVFDDRVLLRCHGCPRLESLPKVAGIGRGGTEEQARQNALYALTLPMNKVRIRRRGYLAVQTWGDGPIEAVETACIMNRVAYGDVTA